MTDSPITEIWHPVDNGISVSGLQLWLQDRFSFRARYLDGWQEPDIFRKELSYGLLFGSAVEGWVKTRQHRGRLRFLQKELERQNETWANTETLSSWSSLAAEQSRLFVERYSEGRSPILSDLTEAEKNIRIQIELPSGRAITLNGYYDGFGEDLLFENKTRGKWDPDYLAENLPLDLQYNFYLLLWYHNFDNLPSKVWYQLVRRPGGFGYRGPSKRKSETEAEYLQRIKTHMNENPDYYFWRIILRPSLRSLQRFCSVCLYPMLEGFLDWYEYVISPSGPNTTDWMTPEGVYNPFWEQVPESYRTYRLTGSPAGLIKKPGN